MSETKEMERKSLVFIIKTTGQQQVLARILNTLSRQRTPVVQISAKEGKMRDGFRLSIRVYDNVENACRLSKRLSREIDVISVRIFNPQNSRLCKTETRKSSLPL